jgi:hypothetical protein
VIDPKESSTLYVATRENSVFKSTDAGVSWKPANNVYADTVAIDPTNSSILYASEGTYQGRTYKSEDGGGTWRALSEISELLAYNGLKSIVIDPSAPSTVYGVTNVAGFPIYIVMATPVRAQSESRGQRNLLARGMGRSCTHLAGGGSP